MILTIDPEKPACVILRPLIFLSLFLVLISCSSNFELNPGNTDPDQFQGVLFDDFETPVLGGGGWTWGDSTQGASASISLVRQGAKFGKGCGRIDFKPGKGIGCGAAEASPYQGQGVNAVLAKRLVIWVKAPDSIHFQVHIHNRLEEISTPYLSTALQGYGRWWAYSVPMANFSPAITQIAPLTTTANSGSINSVGIFVPGGQKEGTILIDNIYFQ